MADLAGAGKLSTKQPRRQGREERAEIEAQKHEMNLLTREKPERGAISPMPMWTTFRDDAE